MGNRVWKGEPSAGGRAGTIIALGIAALVVAGDGLDTRAIVRFRICRRRSRSLIFRGCEGNRQQGRGKLSWGRIPVREGRRRPRTSRRHHSGRQGLLQWPTVPGEHPHNRGSGCDPAIEPGTQLDALYDRPHKEITNESGTLIIIHDADSSEWHFFECLI